MHLVNLKNLQMITTEKGNLTATATALVCGVVEMPELSADGSSGPNASKSHGISVIVVRPIVLFAQRLASQSGSVVKLGFKGCSKNLPSGHIGNGNIFVNKTEFVDIVSALR